MEIVIGLVWNVREEEELRTLTRVARRGIPVAQVAGQRAIHALQLVAAVLPAQIVVSAEEEVAPTTPDPLDRLHDRIEKMGRSRLLVLPVPLALGPRHGLVPGLQGAGRVADRITHLAEQQPCRRSGRMIDHCAFEHTDGIGRLLARQMHHGQIDFNWALPGSICAALRSNAIARLPSPRINAK
jgi:hypothetical protein